MSRQHPGYHLWQRSVQTNCGDTIYFPSEIGKWLFRKIGETWCVWPPHNERPAYQFAGHPLYLTPFNKTERKEKCPSTLDTFNTPQKITQA